jgi:murein DD-endopeptidase MepM/ murein hydrolase activator NlpD
MISGYPVTSPYGMRKHPIYGGMKKHGGIDVAGMRSGAPYALNVPGVAGPPMPDGSQYESGYGNFIDIQIPSLGNLYFRFAHMLKKPNYKPGQQIPAGKIFGYAGTTGASTGVHLHFEVNKSLSGYGGDRDPMPYGKYKGMTLDAIPHDYKKWAAEKLNDEKIKTIFRENLMN